MGEHGKDAPDRLISMKETVLRVGTSSRTIYRSLAAGEFPKPVHWRGRNLFSEREVNEHIERLKRERDR